MAKDLAIILNNGNLNSAVATALAAQRYRPILLHAEITTQAGSRTRAAYDQQVGFFKPYREHTLQMPFLAMIQPVGQPLSAISDSRYATALSLQLQMLMPLVAAAARFAMHYQAAAIYLGLRTGAQGDELAQATEFMQIWNELIQHPCGHGELEIAMPLLELDPWQVVDVGFQANAPLDRTWSCTEDTQEPCWNCRGCRQREAAFQQAGKPDPLKVPSKNV